MKKILPRVQVFVTNRFNFKNFTSWFGRLGQNIAPLKCAAREARFFSFIQPIISCINLWWWRCFLTFTTASYFERSCCRVWWLVVVVEYQYLQLEVLSIQPFSCPLACLFFVFVFSCVCVWKGGSVWFRSLFPDHLDWDNIWFIFHVNKWEIQKRTL